MEQSGPEEVVEFNLGDLSRRYRLSAEPIWVAGATEGSEVFFQTIGAAAQVTDSTIAVADGRSREIAFIRASGAVVLAGGAGGPDELTSAASLHPRADGTLVIHDERRDRLVSFDEDGRLVDASTVSGSSPEITREQYVPLTRDSYVLAQVLPPSRTAEAGVRRREGRVLHVRDGRVDSVGFFQGPSFVMAGGRAMLGVGDAPFGASTSIARGEGGIWVGDQARAEVQFWPMDGGRTVRVRWNGGPDRTLTDDRVNEFIEDLLARVPTEAAGGREAVLTYFRDFEFPEKVPAFDEVLPDGEGGVWIGEYAGPLAALGVKGRPPLDWLHLTKDGSPTGVLSTPAGFQPLQFGDGWVLGRFVDSLDVESVRKYEIVDGLKDQDGRSGAG